MILAAGLGTRLRPLSTLCAKPAMPVRDMPVIAYTLALLARHRVTEVVINLHHLPDTVRDAVERHCPPSITVHYSYEPELLGTGGGIKATAAFLRESDPSIILAGDMLLDLDLTAAVARHRERADRYTLLLREDDPRAVDFGTIGLDDVLGVRRVGTRLDLGAETKAALFTGVRIAAARGLSDFPAASVFEDLTDWLGPMLARGAGDIRADCLPASACTWEPVGTPREYLEVNLSPPPLSYAADLAPDEGGHEAAQVRGDVVLGAGAEVHPDADLHRAVVWPGEHVAAGTHGHDGVFAGGLFHACASPSDAVSSVDGPLRERGAGKLAADSEPGGSS